MKATGKCAALLVLALAPCWACAEDVEFHPPAQASDPTALEVMRDLAERVLPVYQENDPERYLSNLSALQVVTGGFAAALESRQTLRERRPRMDAERPDGGEMLFDIYAQARATEAQTKLPFAQAFAQAFRDEVSRLSDRDAYAVTTLRSPSLAALQATVQRQFDARRAKDHISIADAVELINTFFVFDAYRSFNPLLATLDAEDDQRRYTAEQRIHIKTPDGASLELVFVRPKNPDKPLPTLLEFTIYVDSPNYAKECAAHGYVGVVAYTRETPQSFYRVAPYETEGDDARTVIEWIASQPWSDGRVGMYGGSYSGFTEWAAARKLPAALQAIATAAPTAPGIDFPMRGNVFRNSAYRWVYNVTNKKGWDGTYADPRWAALQQQWYLSGKSYFEFDHTGQRPNQFFHRWLHHPSYDTFWQQMIPFRKQFAQINIPVLTTAGYYGGDEVGALYYFTQHYRYNPEANHTLLIGPYDDNVLQDAPSPTLRSYQIDPVAMVDLHELRYQWFDFVFKGRPKPALLADRVNFEVMGANEWRHVPSLAAMANGTQRFYLDAAAPVAAATRAPARADLASRPGQVLAMQKPTAAHFITQTVDFTDRSDFMWTPPFNIVDKSLPLHNGVEFVSEPLSHETELNGLFSGRLDFTLNRLDVDLNVAIYELLSTGEYLELFDPIFTFRASYAGDREHRHLLKDGERQRLSFTGERLTSRRLQAGSRLIVVLGVSKRPDMQINYGGGDDVSIESMADQSSPLQIRWYNDSYLDMPVQQ